MTLLEAFDNPLSYKRNRDEERYLSGADGTMYPYGFYVKTDTRSLKIENIIKRASLK
jgi:hypothetical protein